jgi:hypothetical protein
MHAEVESSTPALMEGTVLPIAGEPIMYVDFRVRADKQNATLAETKQDRTFPHRAVSADRLGEKRLQKAPLAQIVRFEQQRGSTFSWNPGTGALITGISRFVQLMRSSSPVARQTVCGPGAVYRAVGIPRSSTTHPDQHPFLSGPSGDGESAIGKSSQCTRSELAALATGLGRFCTGCAEMRVPLPFPV